MKSLCLLYKVRLENWRECQLSVQVIQKLCGFKIHVTETRHETEMSFSFVNLSAKISYALPPPIVNWELKWELKQPRRRQQQKSHKFAYLTMKNSIFARFARAYFIFWHFEDVLVLSTTCNDLFCSCVDDVSIWWQMLIFVFLCPKRWFQFNSRIVRTHYFFKQNEFE